MFRKQINGTKFVERNRNNRKLMFVLKDNIGVEYPYEAGLRLYKQMYASKKADKVFDRVLKELGLNLKTAHLLTDKDVIMKDGKPLTFYYAGIKKTTTSVRAVFNDYMEKALREENIDLSFISAETNKYGLTIKGNAGAIAWDYRNMLFDKPWQTVKVDHNALIKFVNKSKNVKIFEDTNEGIRSITKDQLLSTKFGTESSHMGIGSQASDIIRSVTLKMDEKDNILIDHSIQIWD